MPFTSENPFPTLLLVVLTLFALAAAIPVSLFTLFMAALSFAGGGSLQFVLSLAHWVSVSMLLILGPGLAWSMRRRWGYEVCLLCLVVPLLWLAVACSKFWPA